MMTPPNSSPILKANHNCWRIAHAKRFAMLVDAQSYFGAVREAIRRARYRVFILSWDIDSRMQLVPGGADDGYPESLGDFLHAVVSERSELLERVWHILTYLLFPLSGAGFLVEWLPVSAQKVVLWLPMVHGVEMLRSGFFGGLIRPHYDVGYLAMANLILMFFGLAMTRQIRQHVQPE
jgi:capsular polysaccharide transport system permease protein